MDGVRRADSITVATIEEGTGNCVCPVGHAITDYNSSGMINLVGSKHCVMCQFNSYIKTDDPYTCMQCPDLLMHRTQPWSVHVS